MSLFRYRPKKKRRIRRVIIVYDKDIGMVRVVKINKRKLVLPYFPSNVIIICNEPVELLGEQKYYCPITKMFISPYNSDVVNMLTSLYGRTLDYDNKVVMAIDLTQFLRDHTRKIIPELYVY